MDKQELKQLQWNYHYGARDRIEKAIVKKVGAFIYWAIKLALIYYICYAIATFVILHKIQHIWFWQQ
jgi:hypothetical protein